jgi:hypothetical protein
MPRFSRGVRPSVYRDWARILQATPPGLRDAVDRAARRLLDELAVDPHLKGVACPTPMYPLLRRMDDGPLRLFYWVRQPPLNHLYAEAVGLARI